MLILPLHKRLSADNFPFVTALLIAANVFVFFFLQSGDHAIAERAAKFYVSSGLIDVELPRYLEHIKAKPERAQLAEFLAHAPEPVRSTIAVQAVESDSEFRAALAADPPFANDEAKQQRWREQRAQLDRTWGERIDERFIMRYEHFEPGRIASAMFLHGGPGHLFGNMLFLAFLGLLVEGALGAGLFLAIYLAAGFGGGALSVLRHLGEMGGGLGASGAIAGLMGAYCVLWGLRKVRFFWWFFVVFDYVKAPALVLLPFWLGWELLNLWLNPHAGIGFDVHAGGIASGALLAAAVRWRGLERRAFLDEEERRERHDTGRADALKALGKLEFAKARAALAPLVEAHPQDLALLVPWLRSWRDRPQDAGFHDAARRVLLHPSGKPADVALAREAFAEYLTACGGKPQLAPAELTALARRWLGAGALAEAERTLALQPDVRADGVGEAWLALARAQRERGDAAGAERTLKALLARGPDDAAAAKAKFLLAGP